MTSVARAYATCAIVCGIRRGDTMQGKQSTLTGVAALLFAGGLMGQPDLFSKDLKPSSRDFIYMLEKLAAVSPIKYLGSRLIIRASKPKSH